MIIKRSVDQTELLPSNFDIGSDEYDIFRNYSQVD